MKSTVGKVSAIMILLAFILVSLLVLNVALAQNETVNNTIMNGTENNVSIEFEEILSNETIENVTLEQNETFNETSLSNFTNTTTILNETVYDNSTNVTLNLTINETNITVNETNITENVTDNETSIDIPPIEPVIDPTFDVKLVYPQKITRGESIVVKADLTSDVFAKSVYLKWILPQGMQIVSGNQIETCGDIDSSTGCTSEINIDTTQSALGLEEIKVVVAYEK